MNTITASPTDTELLDWIEHEIRAQIGTGDFWQVMQSVHAGLPLREALQQAIADKSSQEAPTATMLLDGIWRAHVIARHAVNGEVMVLLPDVGSCGWVPVTRLTPLSGGAP